MVRCICLFLFISATAYEANAQEQKFYPENHITNWYSLEEWVAVNMNISYRSLDQSTYTYNNYGFLNSFLDQTTVQINGLPFSANWLSNDLLSLPEFRLTTIDSINYSTNENNFGDYAHNTHSLKIFLNPSLISNQINRINQINDPGPHLSSSRRTPNVEAIRKSTSNYIGSTFSWLDIVFHHSKINRTRTGLLNYDKDRIRSYSIQQRTTGRRTSDNSNFWARNRKRNVFSYVEFDLYNFKWSLLANYFYSSQYYEWYALSGIEVPFNLRQYQFSSSLVNSKKGFYDRSIIHFSAGISDSLEYTFTDVYHRLEEIKMSHSSRFKFGGDNPLKVGIQNSYYDITDRTSNKSINHLESIVYLEKHFSNGFELTSSIGNSKQMFEIAYRNSTPFTIRFSHSQENPFKHRYSMNMWRSGIGFTNLNQDNHRINFDSNSKLRVSELRLFGSHKILKQKINWLIYAKHYWTLVNETFEYQRENNRVQLNSIVNYFDSDNVGLAGGRVEHVWQPDAKLTIRSMLSSNIALYAENAVNSYFERVPSFILAEQIQYRIHDNFIMEVFYRYIPERSIEEYSSILFNGFPSTRIRPISMLNYSTTIWTFNRRMETSLTLRNLLNSTESYDTYGIYYNMSINVSAKINFKTN